MQRWSGNIEHTRHTRFLKFFEYYTISFINNTSSTLFGQRIFTNVGFQSIWSYSMDGVLLGRFMINECMHEIFIHHSGENIQSATMRRQGRSYIANIHLINNVTSTSCCYTAAYLYLDKWNDDENETSGWMIFGWMIFAGTILDCLWSASSSYAFCEEANGSFPEVLPNCLDPQRHHVRTGVLTLWHQCRRRHDWHRLGFIHSASTCRM